MRRDKSLSHGRQINFRLPDQAVLRLEQVRQQTGRESIAEVVAEAVEAFCSGQRTAEDIPYPELTRRNRDILRLVAEGMSTKEIAAELRISVKTAEFHRSQLRKKLGIHRIAGLVRYAIRMGVILP